MAPKLSNEDEPDNHSVGQTTPNCSNLISRKLAVTENFDNIDCPKDQSKRKPNKSTQNGGTTAKSSSTLVEREETTHVQDCFRNSVKQRLRRKRLALPTNSAESHYDSIFKRRRRLKQHMSRENLFVDEDQELRFRFGSLYKNFVLPLGVNPLPSLAQKRLFRKKKRDVFL